MVSRDFPADSDFCPLCANVLMLHQPGTVQKLAVSLYCLQSLPQITEVLLHEPQRCKVLAAHPTDTIGEAGMWFHYRAQV